MERILKCVISVDGTVLVTKQNGFENENNAIKIVGSAVGFETYEKYIDFNNNGTILKSPNLSVGTKDFEYYIPQNLSTGILKYQFVFIDGETIIKSQVVSIEFKESINATELLTPVSTDIFHDFEVRISEVEELVNTFIEENETSITIGTVESGASPSVVNDGTAKDQVWNFVLEKGEQGISISSINLISTVGLIKTYRITLSDNTTFDYTVSDGVKGDTGATGANLTFGASFTTVLPSNPTVNTLYPYHGANGGTVTGGTIKDIDGVTTITTLQSGDSVQYKTTYWQRVILQSVNYQAIAITPNFDIFIKKTVLTHLRNPDELNGNQTYNIATARAYGYINYIESQLTFNRIKCTIFDTVNEDITIKIFERSNTNSFDYTTATALYSQNISGANFPKSYVAGGNEFVLNSEVTISAGKYLFIVFCTTSGNNSATLSIRRFDNNSTGDRSAFYFALNNNTLFAASLPNYAQSSVILYLYKNYKDIEITLKEYVDNMSSYGVSFDNLISGLTATNVKGAIDELVTRLSSLGIADNILATLNFDYYIEEYGNEKLLNGGFELGSNNSFTNWSDLYSSALSETSIVHSGSRALKLIDANANWYNPQIQQNVTVVAGEEYELSFYSRGDGTNDAVFAIYNNTGASYILGSPYGVHTGITGTTYTKFTQRFIIPSGCSSIGIWLFVTNVTGAICYYDDISLKKVSLVNKNGIATSLDKVLNAFPAKTVVFNNSGTTLTATNAEDAIKEVNAKVSDLVEISLPDTIYAVVGDKLQLFFRGIVKAINPYNYDILVTCTKGAKYPRYFEYTPVSGDIGTTTFKIDVKDKDGVVLGTKTVNLVTKSAVQSPVSVKKVLCVGDSLTSAGIWCQEASRRLISTGGTPAGLALSNIQFLGRKTGGGIGWEGTGGWNWNSYITAGTTAYRFQVSGVVTPPAIDSTYTNNGQTFTVAEINITGGTGNIRCLATGAPSASGTLTKSTGLGDSTISFSSQTQDASNPFWNNSTNQLDVPTYVNTYMGGQLDVVYFLLSWNGVSANQTSFSTFISNAKTLIDHIKTNYTNVKIKIMGIQVPSLNGGLGANYGATGSGYADNFGMVKTALNMNKSYQDFANEAAYSSFVEFVNVSSQFDSENNMPQSDVAVNSRSAVTEKRGTNGVHPDTSGYYQIADVVFRNFVANFCQ